MGEEAERRLRETAYEASLRAADKLLQGETTKEEFAREQARKTFERFEDSLTGLFNRDFFDQEIELVLARAKRQEEPLSIIMLDIDDFKEINDTYGHPAGDKVLASLGELLSDSIRASDVAARFGGEEIAILLPVTEGDIAKGVAERLLEAIRQTKVKIKQKEIEFTVSIGIASLQKSNRDITAGELIDRADKALYRAKRKGKDRIEVYG